MQQFQSDSSGAIILLIQDWMRLTYTSCDKIQPHGARIELTLFNMA